MGAWEFLKEIGKGLLNGAKELTDFNKYKKVGELIGDGINKAKKSLPQKKLTDYFNRLGSRSGCKTTQEYLERIKERREAYREDILTELKNTTANIYSFTIKSLFECVMEIKSNIKKSPTGTGGHCFELKNGIFVYPIHKIPVLKLLDLYTDYNI